MPLMLVQVPEKQRNDGGGCGLAWPVPVDVWGMQGQCNQAETQPN